MCVKHKEHKFWDNGCQMSKKLGQKSLLSSSFSQFLSSSFNVIETSNLEGVESKSHCYKQINSIGNWTHNQIKRQHPN